MHYTPGCAVPAARIQTPSRFTVTYSVNRRQNLDACLASAARERAQDYARENLKLDFADKTHWRELAGARGIHLPAWYVTATHDNAITALGTLDKNAAAITAGILKLRQ